MEDERIDRLLDEALGSYANAEPRPGLEGRILARVRGEGTRRNWGFMRWALPLAAAAACAVTVVVLRHHPQPAPPHTAPVQVAAAKPPVPGAPLSQAVPRVHRKRVVVARRPELPKLPVFPTPSPLTPEERVLVAFARIAPDEARELFKETPPEAVQPIRIESIEVQPLQISEDTQ